MFSEQALETTYLSVSARLSLCMMATNFCDIKEESTDLIFGSFPTLLRHQISDLSVEIL